MVKAIDSGVLGIPTIENNSNNLKTDLVCYLLYLGTYIVGQQVESSDSIMQPIVFQEGYDQKIGKTVLNAQTISLFTATGVPFTLKTYISKRYLSSASTNREESMVIRIYKDVLKKVAIESSGLVAPNSKDVLNFTK